MCLTVAFVDIGECSSQLSIPPMFILPMFILFIYCTKLIIWSPGSALIVYILNTHIYIYIHIYLHVMNGRI